eukprot:TRINITY_DN1921_c2_g1_i1.p1 TRINITY_DN1921_c2_g1~~TRINITY_DN1921_c2_g1_i1.p1  ORF type:complete len:649 (+),score=131.51 TRINITY_DN1921_c2_g1_i1:245-2191(+)
MCASTLEETDKAIINWYKLFDNEVIDYQDLQDGIVAVKIFNQLHPKHAINEDTLLNTDNWVLQKENLDKVVAGLSLVYRRFGTSACCRNWVDTELIAEHGDIDATRKFARILLASMVASEIESTLNEKIGDGAHATDKIIDSVLLEFDLDLDQLESEANEQRRINMEKIKILDFDKLMQPTPRTRRASIGVVTGADYEERITSLLAAITKKDQDIARLEKMVVGQYGSFPSARGGSVSWSSPNSNRAPSVPSLCGTTPGNVSVRSPIPPTPRITYSAIRDELTSKNCRIMDLENDLAAVAEKNEEILRLQDEVQMLEHELSAEKHRKMSTADTSLSDLRSRIKTLESELSREVETSAKVPQMERKNAKLESEIERIKDEYETQIFELEEAMIGMKEDNDKHIDERQSAAKATPLQERVGKLKNGIETAALVTAEANEIIILYNRLVQDFKQTQSENRLLKRQILDVNLKHEMDSLGNRMKGEQLEISAFLDQMDQHKQDINEAIVNARKSAEVRMEQKSAEKRLALKVCPVNKIDTKPEECQKTLLSKPTIPKLKDKFKIPISQISQKEEVVNSARGSSLSRVSTGFDVSQSSFLCQSRSTISQSFASLLTPRPVGDQTPRLHPHIDYLLRTPRDHSFRQTAKSSLKV